jgi:hypothetical protein
LGELKTGAKHKRWLLAWWIDELLAEIYIIWEYRLDKVGNLLEEGMKHKL